MIKDYQNYIEHKVLKIYKNIDNTQIIQKIKTEIINSKIKNKEEGIVNQTRRNVDIISLELKIQHVENFTFNN